MDIINRKNIKVCEIAVLLPEAAPSLFEKAHNLPELVAKLTTSLTPDQTELSAEQKLAFANAVGQRAAKEFLAGFDEKCITTAEDGAKKEECESKHSETDCYSVRKSEGNSQQCWWYSKEVLHQRFLEDIATVMKEKGYLTLQEIDRIVDINNFETTTREEFTGTLKKWKADIFSPFASTGDYTFEMINPNGKNNATLIISRKGPSLYYITAVESGNPNLIDMRVELDPSTLDKTGKITIIKEESPLDLLETIKKSGSTSASGNIDDDEFRMFLHRFKKDLEDLEGEDLTKMKEQLLSDEAIARLKESVKLHKHIKELTTMIFAASKKPTTTNLISKIRHALILDMNTAAARLKLDNSDSVKELELSTNDFPKTTEFVSSSPQIKEAIRKILTEDLKVNTKQTQLTHDSYVSPWIPGYNGTDRMMMSSPAYPTQVSLLDNPKIEGLVVQGRSCRAKAVVDYSVCKDKDQETCTDGELTSKCEWSN